MKINEKLLKKAVGEYLEEIEKYPLVKVNSEIELNNKKFRIRKISKIVFDKDEDNLDKLTTIFSTINSLESDVFYIFHNDDKKHLHFYVGVASDTIRVLTNANDTLEKVFQANFNGCEISDKIDKKAEEMKQLNTFLQKQDLNISMTTAVPSLKSEDEKKEKFTQGLEKFLLSMQDEEYTMMLLAKNISNVIEVRKRGFEELYTSLFPLANIDYMTGENSSYTEGETDTINWSKTINESTSKAIQNPSKYQKWQQAVPIIGGGLNTIKEVIKGVFNKLQGKENIIETQLNDQFNTRNDTKTDGKNETEGASKAIQTSITTGTSSQLTIKTENKTIKVYLDNIEKQLERIHHSQNYGMYDFAAYFLATTKPAATTAANIYNSLIKGDESYINPSYTLNFDSDKSQDVLKALVNFDHPKFSIDSHEVSITSMVNSRELSIAMGLPKKSLPGLYIKESVEFAREIISQKEDKHITIGKIYHLGKIQENDNVNLNLKDLTMHTLITGSTGSGKSTTTYKLVNELKKTGVKFLVIEPTKGEYKHIFGNEKDVKVYGTNINYTPLLKINPFSFPVEKIHVLEHIDKLVEIFNACWPMYAAMPAVLKDAILNAYEGAGWDLESSVCVEKIFPSFDDVLFSLNLILDSSSYSDNTKSDYKGALATRVESLTKGLIGKVFDIDEIEDSQLFDENVIVDISRVGSSETKSLIMGVLLLKLNEYRMASATDEMNVDLKHITVLEEAHHLLPRVSMEQSSDAGNIKGKAVEMLSNSIAEMRTYGEGFIIVDQSPNMLDLSAIRNTNTKIIMRLSELEDRKDIGKSATLTDEQIEELPRLEQGVAVVYQNGWEEAILCKVEISQVEQKFQEYKKPFEFKPDTSLQNKREVDTKIVELLILQIFYPNKRADEIHLLKKWLVQNDQIWMELYSECDNLLECISEQEECGILQSVRILNAVLPIDELKRQVQRTENKNLKTELMVKFIRKYTNMTLEQIILLSSLLKVALAEDQKSVAENLNKKILKQRRASK